MVLRDMEGSKMIEPKKPSAAAMRAAEFLLRRGGRDDSQYDMEAFSAIIDAEFAPVVEALRPFAAIWDLSTPMLRPHVFVKSEAIYKAASEALAALEGK